MGALVLANLLEARGLGARWMASRWAGHVSMTAFLVLAVVCFYGLST